MSNFKVRYEEKLQAFLEYLNEDTSQKAVAKKHGFEQVFKDILFKS